MAYAFVKCINSVHACFVLLTDTMYLEFVEHPKMAAIRSRTVWIHVDVPGQGQDAPDLPTQLVEFVLRYSWLQRDLIGSAAGGRLYRRQVELVIRSFTEYN